MSLAIYKQYNTLLHDDPYSIIEFGKLKRPITREAGHYGPPELVFHRIMVEGDLVYVQFEWRNLGINIMGLLRWKYSLNQFTEHWAVNQDVVPMKKNEIIKTESLVKPI